MTAATVAVLAAQINPFDLDRSERWPWRDGTHPDFWLYRERTIALLKRYMRLSVEVGRLPSMLGREFFRSRITSYHVATFEDTVIFVHGGEQALSKRDPFSQKLVAKIVLQEYTHDEAAQILGCWRRTVGRRFPEAIDRLSEMFLEGGLLSALDEPESMAPETCQEADTEENSLTGRIDGE